MKKQTRLVTIILGLCFWHVGLLAVLSWHAQQDHQDTQQLYMDKIETTITFVDLAE
jgi:hypothetical protein